MTTEREKQEHEITRIIEQDDEYLENYENYSTVNCSVCGARMNIEEWEEFEETCFDCIWEETSGIIDDSAEEEL